MIEITILFIVLLLVMLIVGYFAGRKKDSEEDFQIYGRKLSKLGFITSYVATFIGAGFFIVGSAYAYEFGTGVLWWAAGLLLGVFVFGFFSFWLRNYSDKKDFYNLPDFIRHKFGDGAAKAVAIISLFALVGDLTIQLVSGGKILDVLGIAPYNVAVLITVFVIAIYLLSSGFRAVIWTDFILAILIAILTFTLSYISVGTLASTGIDFDYVPIGTILGFFIFGVFAPFSLTPYFQRIFASKDANTAKHSTWMSGLILFALVILLVGIGYAAKFYFPNIDSDLAFVSLLSNFGGLVLGIGALLIWMSLMSSADTYTFAGAQIATKDIFGRTINRANIRWGIVIVLVFAVILSFLIPSLVQVSLLFAACSMILGPITFFQWFMRFGQKTVVSATIIGVIVLIVYSIFVGIIPTLVAVTFIVSSLAILIGSVIENVSWLGHNKD
ncbi:hypothetical protein K9L67_05870 [Candidatus Woesearchaeota archaeon]|nr:hypothetical protein [Candidatus Woesearchaeota archaeon]MCF8013989.1 hypothetical protein [Candidatus Woesearchaeota archaeon]